MPTSQRKFEVDPAYNWNDHHFLDDIETNPSDAKLFKELLNAQMSSTVRPSTMKTGSILNGHIINTTKDFVIIDVGLKSEALVPKNEFNLDEIEVGNYVEVLLERPEDENGQMVLSREKARRQRNWENIINNYEEGSIIKGKVLRKVRGGLMIDIGVEAFLPGSQIDNKRIRSLDDYLDQIFNFKILKINKERKNIVVSRRELLEEERLHKRVSILETMHEGDLKEGLVKNITDFGVFLDLDGIDGLLHITDITWRRIKHPSEVVSLGDKLKVVILGIDKEKGRVALGLKQKDPNPWDEIEKRHPIGSRVKGKIVNLLPYGAFIEVEPGIEGLIHVSEMSWNKNITDPSEIVKVGDVVEAVVLSFQKDDGKISLGLKQTEKDPWDSVEEKYPLNSIVTAEVRTLTNYGAFVTLEPGIDGLIHISDLSWIKKVSHPSEMLKKGDKINASVLAIDKPNKKITLGIKQLSENPWATIEKTNPVGSNISGIVTKITAFGAFVELENGIEALIHVSELSDRPFGKVEDIVTKGQKITAKIIKVDPEHKKIALSLKERDLNSNSHFDELDDIIVNSETEDKATGKN